MLKNLKIRNFIIAEEVDLRLDKGLHIVTGETGAGKSVLIGALNCLLGAPVKSGMIMNPEKKTIIEGTFAVNSKNHNLSELIYEHNIDLESEEIFITKEISAKGAKVFLNGRRVTNSIIRDFRSELLDFNSQRDQLLLFDNKEQRSFLDKFAGIELQIEEYNELYTAVKASVRELTSVKEQVRKEQDLLDLYTFQRDEIEKAELTADEDNILNKEYNLLSNSEDIINMSSRYEQELFESDNSVTDTINSYISELEKYQDDNDNIKKAAEFLREAQENIRDSLDEIRSIHSLIDLDHSRLTEVENRLDFLNSLQSKYRKTINEIIEYEEKIENEISAMRSSENRISEIEEKLAGLMIEIRGKASDLTKLRKKAAVKFEKQVISFLSKLAFKNPQFCVDFRIEKANELYSGFYSTKEGVDNVEFLFASGPGLPLQKIKDAASGGELSRIMLTIKRMLSANEYTKTIVFDEIDSGIGGKTANILAEFLKAISLNHQVICITHLPQVASMGDKHYRISKESGNKKTSIHVKELDKNLKREEIARMLAGSASDLALLHADELISNKS